MWWRATYWDTLEQDAVPRRCSRQHGDRHQAQAQEGFVNAFQDLEHALLTGVVLGSFAARGSRPTPCSTTLTTPRPTSTSRSTGVEAVIVVLPTRVIEEVPDAASPAVQQSYTYPIRTPSRTPRSRSAGLGWSGTTTRSCAAARVHLRLQAQRRRRRSCTASSDPRRPRAAAQRCRCPSDRLQQLQGLPVQPVGADDRRRR